MLPNFIILGPPKCASSSLHYYLGQHPEIYTSKVKETEFFSRHYEKGLNYYAHYFEEGKGKKMIGEATPTYSFLPFVADRIKENLPDVKLILCFRNPLDRTFSSWLMQKGMGKEKLSLRESIDINLKQMNYVSLEGEKGVETWANALGNYNADESRLRTYVQGGMFNNILDIYYKRFDPSRIKVVFLDDLKNDFNGTMQSVFKFLGVDDSFIVPNNEVVNFHFDRKANKITNKLFGIQGTKFLIGLTPVGLKKRLKKAWKTKNPPKLNQEDRLYLWEIFKDDIEALEKKTGRDLSDWNPLFKKQLVGNTST